MDWLTGIIGAGIGAAGIHLFWKHRYHDFESSLQEASLKKDEDFARDQEQKQALFNSMSEGILALDSEGRVTLINQTLQNWFPFKSLQLGEKLSDTGSESTLKKILSKALKEGKALEQEMEFEDSPSTCQNLSPQNGASVRGDRARRAMARTAGNGANSARPKKLQLQINASAFGPTDAARGVVMVFHDLTRLRELEDTRREFVANVSHELRTPLSLIKGYVETLIDGARNDADLSVKFLNIIDKHTDRLTFLIEDLLTISKLEMGRAFMNLQPESLKELVERVYQDLSGRAEERGTRLELSIAEDLEPQMDADRMEQVFFNLIENAIKYGAKNGSVKVSAEIEDARFVRITVQDDGPGIPEEAIERVFERFYRVDRARSRELGGTGLGLAIVKHIVQSHGGTTWLESALGEGCRFVIKMPLVAPKSGAGR
jgi:two-component system, OmpR family, phosphate regulon sensor histidine kinase PhoR